MIVLPGLVLWFMAAVLTGSLNLSTGDLAEYHRYAVAALHTPILRHLPLEYPPPALAVFLLPLLLPFAYTWAFAVVVGVVLIALLISYDESGVRGIDQAGARRLIAYLALGAVMILTARYDLFAAASAFWAYRAARQGRWSAAWTWSSVGFALKLFPAIFWPALLIAEWRLVGRFPRKRLLWVLGSVLLVAGVPALFDPGAMLNELHYYLHRPTEIGSLASGISLVVNWHSWHYVVSYHSLNTSSPIAAPLATALSVAAGVACIATWWAQAKGRLPLDVVFLTTLTLIVLGMKVFSIQYVLWLMPFWALYKTRISWVLACIANTIVFPYAVSVISFSHVPANSFAMTLGATYLVRDLLIAAGTLAWFRACSTDHDQVTHGPELVSGARTGRPLVREA